MPKYQLAQMTKITSMEQDSIFAPDAPVEEGAEDSAAAAMVTDLGDRVVPFPRELYVMAGYHSRVGY